MHTSFARHLQLHPDQNSKHYSAQFHFFFFPAHPQLHAQTNSSHQSWMRPAREEPPVPFRYKWICFILVQLWGIAITIIMVGIELGAFYPIRSLLYIYIYSRACCCSVWVSVHREGKQNINQQPVLCSIGYHRCRSGECSCTDFLWCKSPQTIFLEQEGCLQTPCFQMCRPPANTKFEPVLLKGTYEICNMRQCNRT